MLKNILFFYMYVIQIQTFLNILKFSMLVLQTNNTGLTILSFCHKNILILSINNFKIFSEILKQFIMENLFVFWMNERGFFFSLKKLTHTMLKIITCWKNFVHFLNFQFGYVNYFK